MGVPVSEQIRPLVALDLFCKAGGAARGLVQAGFVVYGVDIEPQPNYPYPFLRMDALEAMRILLRDGYMGGCVPDFIWASPPCQAFSPTRTINKKPRKPHVDCVTPLRPLLEEWGGPWCIENVPGAPMRTDMMLCGSMFGLGVPEKDALLRRHRVFEMSFPARAPRPCDHKGETIGVYGGHFRNRRRPQTCLAAGHFPHNLPHNKEAGYPDFTAEDAYKAMGLPHGSMTRDELSNAVPPAYSYHIATEYLRWRAHQ